MQHRGSAPTPGLKGRQLHLAAFTILLGLTLSVLDSTAVALGLPTMTRELGVSADEAVWIVNAFQLAALVALLPLAHWGERITYRRIYLTGTALWALASAVACLADSLPLLIAARVAQGLGAAGIMSVNTALVRLTWPPALLGRGVALNSMAVSLATVLGPLVAAALLSLGSWRWLFVMNVPAGLLLWAVGRRTLPANAPVAGVAPPSVLDIALNAGLFILLFMAADSFGRSLKAPSGQGHGLLLGVAMLAAAVVVGTLHVRRQWTREHALLPLDLLRIPLFRLSMLTSVGSFAAQSMTYVVLPFLLLDVWRTTASQAGLFLSCWPVGTIVAAAVVGRLIGRFHGGWLGAVGLAALALGLGLLAYAALAPGRVDMVAWSLGLCGLGFGLFQSPNNHTIITSAPPQRAGAASGMQGSARLTGQTLGATLVAVVFAATGQASALGLSVALALAALLAVLAATASFMRVRYQAVG